MSTTLHLFCGKIAAGKSTLAKRLAEQSGALLISEDDWMKGLFGPEMESFDDYIRYSARLRTVLASHLVTLLKAGNSVALDFPANTRKLRGWMRGIAEAAEVPALLHYLDLPEASCKARMRGRNAMGEHPFAPTDAEFDLISGYFEAPDPGEGVPVVVHGGP
ncbi:ATP-binding protein [Nisaea acidiphila]|uniref:ATP-binding protein n=1 Tax=Nisaea acidiphila TaxID=1862145 RepID=A0A9J7AVB8_9PROT|nr:ATP-binding protein [Nisaea acidiphila]UUX51272.1 ATP-binding protein [Nisaea acidiphila]